MNTKPKTLQQAIKRFADPDNCLNFIVSRRWPNGVECPTCGRKDVRFISTRRMWECKEKHARKQFSVKIGTIFEDSALPLDKWLVAMWMVANCKNGVSSYEIGRALGVTQKSAWFMLHRIRLAMQARSSVQLGGNGKEVEVDETFVGGAARFMHADKRRRRITETGTKDKVAVQGILERGGEVRASVVGNRKSTCSNPTFAHTSKPEARFTQMRSCPIRDSSIKDSSTKSSTTRSLTLMGRFTPTGSKTSGACSSANSKVPISAWNHSTCSATWMSRCSAITFGNSLTMDFDSSTLPRTSSESASPMPKSPARRVRRIACPTRLPRGKRKTS